MNFIEFIIIFFAIGISIFFSIFSLYLYFISFLTPKRRTKAFVISLSIFILFSRLEVSNYSLKTRLIFFIIVLMINVLFFFYGSILRILYHVILYTFIMITSEVVYSTITGYYITDVVISNILPFVIYSLFSCIPLILVLSIVKFLTFFKFDSVIGLKNSEYLLLGIPIILSSIYLLQELKFNRYEKILFYAFLIMINACIILINNNISKKNYLLQQYSYSIEQNKYIVEYLNRQHEVVRLKHDLKNILANFNMFLQFDKIDEAKEQLSKLIDTTALSYDIWSGCIPIDAVLNQKLYLIKQNNIKNRITLQIPMELDTTSIAIDLAAIIGNLLDNAIEASLRNNKSDENEIIINIKYRENKLYIHLANITDKPSIQDFTKKLVKSEKGQNRYGIGINSVKERVDKLKGYYDFKYESGYFKALIILPIS